MRNSPQGGVSLTAGTDRPTGVGPFCLWTNNIGGWSVAQSHSPSLLVKQPPEFQKHCVNTHVSALICQHSCVSTHVSTLICQHSCVSTHVSTLMCQRSYVNTHVSTLMCQHSCVEVSDVDVKDAIWAYSVWLKWLKSA